MSHKRRDGRLSTGDSSDLILEYLESLDSPRALTCWMLYSSGGQGELVQLVNLTCDPNHYSNVRDFRAAYAATKFLSKTKGLKTGIDTAGVAVEAAVKAELKCSQTNNRWRSLEMGSVRSPLVSAIPQIQETILRILGPVPNLRDLEGGWSKGRTTSSSGPQLSPYMKYGSRLDVTVGALRHANKVVRDSPWWGASVLETDAPVSVLKGAFTPVRGNVMLTVPKNAKTDRVICFEPHMNIWLQLQVGRHLRARLRKYGVNLDDQSINQRRARFGSKTGLLSTIDLKSASDTVAVELVNKLLPLPWVCLLHELRSAYTLWPDGQWRKNEKFSSMGNGFTFELESLLFYAICSAMSENVSVYGDDIVVPTENFSRVTEMLEFCGFEVNTSKSYSTSYFRESCGGDYYGGFSCTPVYLRSLPKSTEDVVLLHNQVFRFCRDTKLALWNPFGKLLRKWRKRYPSFTGPSGYGDGHYHVNMDDAEGYSFCRQYQRGWWFDTLSRVYRKGVDSFDGATVRSFPAALCASTGPRAVRSIWASTMDRRYYRLKRVRMWASCWPTASWV